MQKLDRTPVTVNKKFMEYFFPTVLTAMASNIALIVDSILVGNILGSSALAAVNLLSPVIQLYFSLTLMFGLGASTLVSIAKGENNEREANGIFTLGLTVMIILSLAMVALQLVFLNPIVGMLSPDTNLRELVKAYYLPYIFGTPFTILLPGLSYCVRTDGRPKLASNSVIVANAVNLSLDIVFMAVLDMGVMGAALSTVIGNAVGLIMISTHFISKHNTLRIDLSIIKNPKLLGSKFVTLSAVGASGALGAMLITIRVAFLNTYVQHMGDVGSSGVVALSINSSCQIFISTFITGASQTMIPIVGVMLGQKDYEGVRMTFKKAWRVLLIANAVIFPILELFPSAAAGLFGVSDANELAVVVPSIRITTLSFVGLSASFLFLYYFMATKKKAISTLISVVNGVGLIIPFAVLFGELFGITGIWWAFVATQIGTLLIIMIATAIEKRKSDYKDFYLLPPVPESEITAISFTSDVADAAQAAKYILNFMKDNGVSNAVAMRIAVAIEEMAVNTHTKKSNADIDVRISINKDEIIISIRDNAMMSDPLKAKPELWEKLDISGMGVVKAIVKDMEYASVIGFNQTTLILENA